MPASALVVAIDCGKATNHAMLATGERGVIGAPVSLPTLREGVDELCGLIATTGSAEPVVIAIEATGSLHRAWARELERRYPGSLRLFAPSEVRAARSQLGSRAFKTDERDCAALIASARQGLGRPAGDPSADAMPAAVRHRRALVAQRKVTQQQLHDQLNALCPGLSAPVGHGRALKLEDVSGQAVLACAVDFCGRAPAPRSLIARARGRFSAANARYWSDRWRRALPPPPDAELRCEWLGQDLERWRALQRDISACEAEIAALPAASDGQVLVSLPGVAATRAAAFAAHALPIERFASAERLYSATGLAPASYESATLRRRGRISRTGLAEFRDALMGIAWGSRRDRPRFGSATASCAAAAWRRSKQGSRSPATPAGSALPCSAPNNPSTKSDTLGPGMARAVTAFPAMPHDGATWLAARPRRPPFSRRKRKPAARRRLISLPVPGGPWPSDFAQFAADLIGPGASGCQRP